MNIGTSTPFIGDIRREWDWVRVGIEEILDKQPQFTFRPEDVYAECINGTATLFIDTNNNFAVTTIETDRHTGKKTFLIWLAWCSSKGLKHYSFIGMYVPFFEKVARDFQCSFLENRTSLQKLGEHYASTGWQLNTMIFTKEL